MNKRQKLVQKQYLHNEKTVIDRLEYIYDQSLSEIQAKIRNLEFSIGDLQEEYDWMDDTDPKKAVVKSKIQSKIYQKQYQQSLQDQLDGILKQMQTKQFTTVADYLDLCYEDGFVGSLFDLHGQDIPMMMPLNQEAMVRAVQLESKISKGLYTRLGEDVGVLKKRIASEVTRSIATGSSWPQMAKRLENQTTIGYNKSVRIARTEGHRIQTTAAMDAMEQAKDRGADVVKQWDATLDGKTRESHVAVDGEIRELDEPFSNGLQYPGDPAGGAAEVVFCRCALLQRARWALDETMDPDTGEVTYRDSEFTKWNNFTGQLETFDSPDAYGEFKKGFFSPENKEYMNYVQQLEDKYHTKDMRKLLEQMTDREYKHYSKLLANNPVYNKGVKPKEPQFFHDVSATTTKIKSAMADADYQAYMQMVQSNPDIAQLYDLADHLNRVDYVNGGGCFYGSGSGRIEFGYPDDRYIRDGMSKYHTLAHEYGHFFDTRQYDGLTFNEYQAVGNVIGRRKRNGEASSSDQFLSALRKDMEFIKSNYTDIRQFCLAHNNTTVGIQDAVDGLGLGRIRWGHGDRYYNRFYNDRIKSSQGWFDYSKELKKVYSSMGFDASNQAKVKNISRQYETASELWANIASAVTTGGAELDGLKKYFPECTNAFLEIVRKGAK